MANALKILKKMRNNPHGNWRIEDLKVAADSLGIRYGQHGTSHVIFRAKGYTVSVPAARPIKPPYIRQFLEMIDA